MNSVSEYGYSADEEHAIVAAAAAYRDAVAALHAITGTGLAWSKAVTEVGIAQARLTLLARTPVFMPPLVVSVPILVKPGRLPRVSDNETTGGVGD